LPDTPKTSHTTLDSLMFAVSRSFKNRLRSDGAVMAKIDEGVVSYEHQTPLQYIAGGAVLGELSAGFREAMKGELRFVSKSPRMRLAKSH
jgi:hypothetical protein